MGVVVDSERARDLVRQCIIPKAMEVGAMEQQNGNWVWLSPITHAI